MMLEVEDPDAGTGFPGSPILATRHALVNLLAGQRIFYDGILRKPRLPHIPFGSKHDHRAQIPYSIPI